MQVTQRFSLSRIGAGKSIVVAAQDSEWIAARVLPRRLCILNPGTKERHVQIFGREILSVGFLRGDEMDSNSFELVVFDGNELHFVSKTRKPLSMSNPEGSQDIFSDITTSSSQPKKRKKVLEKQNPSTELPKVSMLSKSIAITDPETSKLFTLSIGAMLCGGTSGVIIKSLHNIVNFYPVLRQSITALTELSTTVYRALNLHATSHQANTTHEWILGESIRVCFGTNDGSVYLQSIFTSKEPIHAEPLLLTKIDEPVFDVSVHERASPGFPYICVIGRLGTVVIVSNCKEGALVCREFSPEKIVLSSSVINDVIFLSTKDGLYQIHIEQLLAGKRNKISELFDQKPCDYGVLHLAPKYLDGSMCSVDLNGNGKIWKTSPGISKESMTTTSSSLQNSLRESLGRIAAVTQKIEILQEKSNCFKVESKCEKLGAQDGNHHVITTTITNIDFIDIIGGWELLECYRLLNGTTMTFIRPVKRLLQGKKLSFNTLLKAQVSELDVEFTQQTLFLYFGHIARIVDSNSDSAFAKKLWLRAPSYHIHSGVLNFMSTYQPDAETFDRPLSSSLSSTNRNMKKEPSLVHWDSQLPSENIEGHIMLNSQLVPFLLNSLRFKSLESSTADVPSLECPIRLHSDLGLTFKLTQVGKDSVNVSLKSPTISAFVTCHATLLYELIKHKTPIYKGGEQMTPFSSLARIRDILSLLAMALDTLHSIQKSAAQSRELVSNQEAIHLQEIYRSILQFYCDARSMEGLVSWR